MTINPDTVIYGGRDATVREAAQAWLGLPDVELLPSAARGAGSGNGVTVAGLQGFGQAEFLLELTAAATEVDDTLDVFVDCFIDGTAVNIVHFTQVLGNGADALKFIALCPRQGASDEFAATADVAAGGTPRPFIGDAVRVRWAVVDPTGANASFTFRVVASFKQ